MLTNNVSPVVIALYRFDHRNPLHDINRLLLLRLVVIFHRRRRSNSYCLSDLGQGVGYRVAYLHPL